VSLEAGRYSQSAGISMYSRPRYSYSKPPVLHRAPAVHRMLLHVSRADASKQLLTPYWLRAGKTLLAGGILLARASQLQIIIVLTRGFEELPTRGSGQGDKPNCWLQFLFVNGPVKEDPYFNWCHGQTPSLYTNK
jgi:hypothetical protein